MSTALHRNQVQLFLVINLCFKSVEDPRGRGSPRDTPTARPLKYPAFLQSQLSFGASQWLPGEILSVFLPLPSGLWSVWSRQSSRGLHAVHELCRRPYSQINPIYQHRKGKRNTDESLKWEGSSVTSFKNTVGYVTLYHYNSPLKALPRHLAYVWTWNWIHLCGNFNRHQSEKARTKARCTGELKNVPTCEIKTHKHVYTSFTQHETCLIALVCTVFVAHSGKRGWLHKNLNSAGISNLVRVNKELLLFKIN